jgi:G3E family GTPase
MVSVNLSFVSREELLVEIKKLAQAGKYDYIVIESTGISEPLQVAETFTFVDEESGESLSAWAKLDTMVTVVDALSFFDYVDSEKNVQDTGEAVGPDDVRVLSQLLIDQVEFADVILLNKCDLVTDAHLDRVEHALRSLNAAAKIIRTTNSAVPLSEVLNTGLFDFARASANPGWLRVLRGTAVPESEEYGITSFVYRASRPFHPHRLYALTGAPIPLPNVIRSKGFVWLANHPDMRGVWSSAGRMYSVEPDESWDTGNEPRQELVIIGIQLDRSSISTMLDICLATDEELEANQWHVEGQEDPYDDFSAESIDEDGAASDNVVVDNVDDVEGDGDCDDECDNQRHRHAASKH